MSSGAVHAFSPAAPSEPLVRVRLLVAYDGSGFSGFSPQPGGVRTVGGVLAEALGRTLRRPVELTCAGRTDAGVHAWGQVVSFDAPASADLAALQRSCNKALSPAVVVRAAEATGPGFDARRSATARRYRYTVLNRPVPDPFLAATTWHVPTPLDLRALRLACDPLHGEHDFSSFCRRPRTSGAGPSLVRRVVDARWRDLGHGLLRFEVEASSFCQQMVRSLVGTIVEMGLARLRPGDMAWILACRDRAAAGAVAPPHGLCLWRVRYGPERPFADAPDLP